jgi:HTH-type transcriptional regulator / antitoxin HipB
VASQTVQSIAELLAATRKQKGMTQQELASLLGVPQSYVAKVESGKTDIRTSTLMEMARLLDLEVMFVPKHKLPAVRSALAGQLVPEQAPQYRSAYEPDEDDEHDEV